MNEEKEKEMRELAAEAEWHQQQAKEIQGQIQNLQMIELEIAKTIEALKSIKEKNISLINLGSGVFVKGELKDVDKLLVNVGANILTEKNVKETLEFLEERKKEIDESKKELFEGIKAISSRLKEIDLQARKIMENEEKV